MREKTVRMFYCDHCPKKGQRRDVIAKHEERCVRNPLRRCGICNVQYTDATRDELAEAAAQGIDAVRTRADGCPVCMVIGVNLALQAMPNETADDCFGAPLPAANPVAFELSTWDFRKELSRHWAERNAERFIGTGGIYGL